MMSAFLLWSHAGFWVPHQSIQDQRHSRGRGQPVQSKKAERWKHENWNRPWMIWACCLVSFQNQSGVATKPQRRLMFVGQRISEASAHPAARVENLSARHQFTFSIAIWGRKPLDGVQKFIINCNINLRDCLIFKPQPPPLKNEKGKHLHYKQPETIPQLTTHPGLLIQRYPWPMGGWGGCFSPTCWGQRHFIMIKTQWFETLSDALQLAYMAQCQTCNVCVFVYLPHNG